MTKTPKLESAACNSSEDDPIFQIVHSSVHKGHCSEDGWVDLERVVSGARGSILDLEAPKEYVISKAHTLVQSGVLEIQNSATGDVRYRLS